MLPLFINCKFRSSANHLHATSYAIDSFFSGAEPVIWNQRLILLLSNERRSETVVEDWLGYLRRSLETQF